MSIRVGGRASAIDRSRSAIFAGSTSSSWISAVPTGSPTRSWSSPVPTVAARQRARGGTDPGGGCRLITGLRGRQRPRGTKHYEIRAEFQKGTDVESKDVPGRLESGDQPFRTGTSPPGEPHPRRPRRPDRRPVRTPSAKTDQDRLRNVKQLLVNAATVERFEIRSSQLGRYPRSSGRSTTPGETSTPRRPDFAVEIVSPERARRRGWFDVYLRTPEGPRWKSTSSAPVSSSSSSS